MGIFHGRDSPQARRIVWGSPQWSASKIGPAAATSTAAPLPEPCGPTEKIQSRSDGIWLGLAGLQGLPTRCGCTRGCRRGRGLSLCQKAANFIISGKLSQDGSVSQHTPGKKGRERAMHLRKLLKACIGTEYFESSLLKSVVLWLAASTSPGRFSESQDRNLHFNQEVTEKYWLRTTYHSISRYPKTTGEYYTSISLGTWNLYVK